MHLPRRLWSEFRYRHGTMLVFRGAMGLLSLLIIIVMVGIIRFCLNHPQSVFGAVSALAHVLTMRAFGLALLTGCLIWLLVRQVALHSLAAIFTLSKVPHRLTDYVLRLLATLPTLILGNAVLAVSSGAGITPSSTWATIVFIVVALTIVALPTVLHVGNEILRDYDKRQIQHAAALGIADVSIAWMIVLRGIRRSFNAALTLALGRILIEGYVVVDRSAFHRGPTTAAITDASDIMDTFHAVYGSMTINSNVGLIVLLFVMALLVNFWGFASTSVGGKP